MLSLDQSQRAIEHTILATMQNGKPWEEIILIKTIALGMAVPEGDVRLALVSLGSRNLITNFTTAFGAVKWTITDTGKSALLA
jgi:hypothetical protein